MTRFRILLCTLLAAAGMVSAGHVSAADPFNKVSDEVNQKLVKLFGSGGFRGIANYGTGIVVSPDGYILTSATQMLDTSELIVHLYDGRRVKAVLIVSEPELDVALVKIKVEGKKIDEPTDLDLPYFDIAAAAKQPLAVPGDWVLSFANIFEIAMRDEPVSVQRGVVAAYAKLHGRRGIFDFPYNGDVYVVDAITNNPGAGGGALTDRKGRLLGLVGREIKNTLTETWLNYAIPIGAKVDIKDGDKTVTISIPEFTAKAMKGQYKPVNRAKEVVGAGGYHGIVFVPNVLERTPPYVESVYPGSPAAKAGLKPDDLVSFIDGEPVYSIKTFHEFLRRTRPGAVVRFEVRRGEGLQTVELKLEEYPKGVPLPPMPPAPKQ
ncbi:S1C family serine protease [Fimbriiglobus ruber]|uniref:Serine protease MucD/AlgY associated with sigma factor RpoE n=1 Tax=Fimbriiglobus ruber TaxID=1908690 RepID=A0A225E2K4_9BACT|nr:trypsin-like peptidase domain-containing protein [Fimbriiglobus ruber]OWK44306.1 Serine protease precursor MucD/AlgY associated with sigma factor RpoE [Fimbriiglobus ruber]